MNGEFAIRFPNSKHPEVRLPREANPSEHLTIENSPVLFGCRTGICGTCLVHVDVNEGQLNPPSQDEVELLKIICPNDPYARLACQIKLTADLEIRPIRK
jgi:ferredoxin